MDNPKKKKRAILVKDLPQTFANDVMKFEMEIETKNIQMGTVTRLMELYMQAVEHYEAKEDKRYEYFQKKLNYLMTDPEVQTALAKDYEIGEREKIKKMENPEEKKKAMKKIIKNKLNEEKKMDKNYTSELVKKKQESAYKSDDLINFDIFMQKKKLLERLDKRKLMKKAKSVRSCVSSKSSTKSEDEKNKEEIVKEIKDDQVKLNSLKPKPSLDLLGIEKSQNEEIKNMKPKSARPSKKKNFFARMKKKKKKTTPKIVINQDDEEEKEKNDKIPVAQNEKGFDMEADALEKELEKQMALEEELLMKEIEEQEKALEAQLEKELRELEEGKGEIEENEVVVEKKVKKKSALGNMMSRLKKKKKKKKKSEDIEEEV